MTFNDSIVRGARALWVTHGSSNTIWTDAAAPCNVLWGEQPIATPASRSRGQ